MIDLKGFEKYLYEEELSENTIEVYMRGVRDYSKLHRTITKPFLIDYKQKMIEKYSPKTVNLRITAMLRYCEYKDIPMKLKQVKTAKQMMELQSGGSAELTASVDQGYMIPFIGELRQLITDNKTLFDQAPEIEDLLNDFLNNKEETADYPYITVRWLHDVKAKQLNVKIVFNYYKGKYIQMHNMQSPSRVTKERMEYAIEYLFESGSFVKGETV